MFYFIFHLSLAATLNGIAVIILTVVLVVLEEELEEQKEDYVCNELADVVVECAIIGVWQYGQFFCVGAHVLHITKWLQGPKVTLLFLSSHTIHFVAVWRYNTCAKDIK